MAGETALARQLKKLAAPQTSRLLQNRLRKSLLFDPGYAATLDRDVIFAYGVCGIEKLEDINPRFSIFKNNLFSNNYCELERSVQTVSVNKKLDEVIEHFLRLLSPYFLNAASAQALEWLIYRYHIHQYNTDELIACALPHFNTSHFVRVVQLLSLDDEKSRWYWLKSIQKSGQPLEYPVILNRFITDGGFRTFVCKLAPNVIKVYDSDTSVATAVVSFSMQTLYDAVNKKPTIDDSDLVSYIPYLLKGFKSDFNKYSAAAYLVFGCILTKVNIDDKLLNDLLLKVFENVNEELLKSAFELLLVAYQHQPIKKMSSKLLNLILAQTNHVNHLLALTQFDFSSLFRAIIKRSVVMLFEFSCKKPQVPKSFKKLSKFCSKLLHNIKLPDKLVTLLLNVIVKEFLKNYGIKKKTNGTVRKCAQVMIAQIEAKYPDSFDMFINKFLKTTDKKNGSKFTKLINLSICNLRSAVVKKSKTSLVLGLNHANEDIRKISVEFLIQKAIAEEVTELDFLKESLKSKLLDDSPSLVLEVLNNAEVLFKYVEKINILSGLSYILQKPVKKSSPWYVVQMSCIDILTKHFTADEYSLEVLICLLPFIFPLKKSYEEGYSKIFNSAYKSKLGSAQQEKLGCSIIFSINKYVASLSAAEKSVFLATLSERCLKTSSYSLYVIYILAAGHAIVSSEKLEEISVWIEQLLCFISKILSQPDLVFDTFEQKTVGEDFVRNISDCLSKGKFPVSTVYTVLYSVVTNVKLGFQKDSNLWLPSNDSSPEVLTFKILMSLFQFCIVQLNSKNSLLSDAFRTIFSQLINSQFASLKELFSFLSIIWSGVPKAFSADFQVVSISVARSFCQADYSWLFDNIALCLNLINVLSSPLQVVRDNALSLLGLLLQNSKGCNAPLIHLFQVINEHAEEISIDQEQFHAVVSNFLMPACDFINFEDLSKYPNNLKMQCIILHDFFKVLSDNLTPYAVKHKILIYLQYVDHANILSACIPVISKLLNALKETDCENELTLNIMELLIKKYTPQTAKCLKEYCTVSDMLFECLSYSHGTSQERSIQKFALTVLSKNFFTAIQSVIIQQKILRTLLDLYATSMPPLNLTVKKVLTKLSTYVLFILKDFHGDEKNSPSTLKDVKKSRNDTKQVEPASFDSGAWRKLALLLEIVQNKSKLDKSDQIIPNLFAILNKTLNADSQSSVEYLRQLLLSSIYNCCQQLGSKGLDESQFQVELIVQCIRSSKNPKTHQHSLLLLNLAATLLPEYVLKNVMSIFTFMGSNLIRQDDSYSFQVISQTIETIVPSLLEASSHQKDNDPVQVVAEVIRVFVDSLTDIPQHRQMPLFTKLISTLDPSQYLWLPLGQICDQYATLFHNTFSENAKTLKLSPTLEFAVNFHKQFTPVVQIDTCINLLKFLMQLPDTKEDINKKDHPFKEPFNVANHTDEQLQIYKHNVLSYINIWLSSNAFITQVSELDSNSQSNLDNKYVVLLENALIYLQHQKDLQSSKKKNGQNSNFNVFPLLVDLVCNVNSMLPPRQFVKVLRTLLSHSEPIIQNKAVEILNSKLESHHHHDLTKEENRKTLLKLLKPLSRLIKNLSDCDVQDETTKRSQQTILYSLHLLTKIIGPSYPSKFYKVLLITVKILNSSQSEELTVHALLCLAQLCSSLNVEVLPQLNEFMPPIMSMLTDSNVLDMAECLISGIIVALQSLIEYLGSFLSSYMQELVTGICLLSSKCQQLGKKNVHEKFLSLQTLLAKEMPLRILLTALESSYTSLQIVCPDAVLSVAQILDEKLRACDYEDIKTSLVPLEKLCLSLLSFRSTHVKKSTFESTSSVECSIVGVLKTFVMKLSVSLFEKFFKKVFQWVSNVEDDAEQKWRIFTFYHLTSELSDCLKNLFVVVAKCFLRHSASALDSNNYSKQKSMFEDDAIFSQLLSNILDTLRNCFMYGDGHLLDKEHFELLMLPLIDQLENCSDDYPETYQERVTKHLSSCVAHFMNAVSDSALWKKANYQILLKTRHSEASVRFAAIQVVREVVKVMGDSYLVLLPESIPFLAEVMEDESSEVEQECQSVILEMEKILGEPIRKYF